MYLKIKINQHDFDNIKSVEDITTHIMTSLNCLMEDVDVTIEDITEDIKKPLRFFDVRFSSEWDTFERFIVQARDAGQAIEMASEFAGENFSLESINPIREGLHPRSMVNADGGVLLAGHGDGYHLTMNTNPRERVEREIAQERSRLMLRQRIEREVRSEKE